MRHQVPGNERMKSLVPRVQKSIDAHVNAKGGADQHDGRERQVRPVRPPRPIRRTQQRAEDDRREWAVKIERHVVRLLVEKASDELLAKLVEDARTLDRWMNELGHDEGHGSLLHLEFHLKLARSTGFTSLEENLKRMSMRALLTTRWLKNQRLPHPTDFHQQLVRSLQQRDHVVADRTMRDHLYYAIDYRARLAKANGAPDS